MLALFMATVALAKDAPPVWDWSQPRRYRLSVNEALMPAIQIGLADNIMTSLGSYAVTLAVTCASGQSAGTGGTTVACKVDSATLSGAAGSASDQVKLDESLRQLESWVRGATVDFVQKSDGEIKRIGEVAPGPDAERMSQHRTAWLNIALGGCLRALDVVVSLDADEWRTPLPHGGSLKLHVTERTDSAVTFGGEHGEIARISVEFDPQARVITKSRIYYAAVGNTSMYYWHQELTSELLEAQ